MVSRTLPAPCPGSLLCISWLHLDPDKLSRMTAGKNRSAQKWPLVKVKGSLVLPDRPSSCRRALLLPPGTESHSYHQAGHGHVSVTLSAQEMAEASSPAAGTTGCSEGLAAAPEAGVRARTSGGAGSVETARPWLGGQSPFVPMALLKLVCQRGLWGNGDTKPFFQ